MKSYHFSIGNSSVGPIGYCARIVASSRQAAVKRLKKILEESFAESADVWGVEQGVVCFDGLERREGEYITVYFNSDKITTEHIDEEEEVSS